MVARKNLMEFDQYIAPDGAVYNFETTDKFVSSETNMGMPPIEYITQRGTFQHGETVLGYRLRPRVLQLVHRSNSGCRNEYWTARNTLLNYIRPNRQAIGYVSPGTLRKHLSNGTTRDIDVFIESGPEFSTGSNGGWDEWSFQETLRFIAPDPTFYDPTVRTSTFSLAVQDDLIFYNPSTGVAYTSITFRDPAAKLTSTAGLVFGSDIISSTIAITYTGTWLSYPTITIIGPLNGPLITNLATGEYIRVMYDVSGGETLTISLQYGHKAVTNNLGTNLIGTVTSESDLSTFHIEPEPGATGGVNTISVEGTGAIAGTTSVAVSYYTRYIGI